MFLKQLNQLARTEYRTQLLFFTFLIGIIKIYFKIKTYSNLDNFKIKVAPSILTLWLGINMYIIIVSNLVEHSFCEHTGIARRALNQLSY